MSERPNFDLRTEPWILARFPDGAVRELSLKEVFSQAHEIRDLVGEVPTQVFAITRLLLAILLRSLPEIERPVDDWAELWNMETLPTEWIFEYLEDERWADRFDLLHPEKPFYQVAGLHTAKGETSSLERLIADVPNGEPFFTTRRGPGMESLSFAEAARWLIHAQAYDPSGIKSGSTDDDRVKRGKGYPIGTGWSGELGGILNEGVVLKETLLLNLVLGETADKPFASDDMPLWERPLQTGAVESGNSAELRIPTGQADLLTWQSRRIRLAHDDKRVSSVLVANGDQLRPQNRHAVEMMTGWRRSQAQEKKLGEPLVFMPRGHDPERSFWRGLSALIPQDTREKMVAGGSASLPAGSIHWLWTIRNHGILSPDLIVRAHAFGISYGTQSSTIDEIIDDVLDIHLVLLAEEGRALATAAEDMISATEDAIFALAQLAGNLELASGGQPDGARERARERAYFEIDPEFRRWLGTLHASAVIDEAKTAWVGVVEKIILRLGEALVKEAGAAAWLGRERSIGGHVSSSEAREWFRRSLHKAFSTQGAEENESPKEEVR